MTTAASTPQEEPVREAEADLLARRRAAAVGDVYDCGEADAEHPAVCDVDGGAGRHARRAEPVHGGEDGREHRRVDGEKQRRGDGAPDHAAGEAGLPVPRERLRRGRRREGRPCGHVG
jgi:hypothetical protein